MQICQGHPGRISRAFDAHAELQDQGRQVGLSTETGTLGRSENSEHEPDGPVDISCLHGIKAAGEVAQSAGVDRAHLVDENAGPSSVQLDLRPEDRRLRAGGSRGDDQRGEQDSVTLDRNCVPGAALLVPGGVLAGAQPEQVTTH
jgi:hypothetical protein